MIIDNLQLGSRIMTRRHTVVKIFLFFEGFCNYVQCRTLHVGQYVTSVCLEPCGGFTLLGR